MAIPSIPATARASPAGSQARSITACCSNSARAETWAALPDQMGTSSSGSSVPGSARSSAVGVSVGVGVRVGVAVGAVVGVRVSGGGGVWVGTTSVVGAASGVGAENEQAAEPALAMRRKTAIYHHLLRINTIHFQGSAYFDAIANGPCHRAEISVKAPYSLGDIALLGANFQPVGNVDAFYDQHFAVLENLASGLGGQITFACGDAARLQRASERARQSTRGRGDQVIQGGCVWLMDGQVGAVVFGDLRVNAKSHRLCFGGQISATVWALDALNANVRDVNRLIAHESASFCVSSSIPQSSYSDAFPAFLLTAGFV